MILMVNITKPSDMAPASLHAPALATAPITVWITLKDKFLVNQYMKYSKQKLGTICKLRTKADK